jgi:hypothetical protein
MAGNALCTMHKDELMHNNFALPKLCKPVTKQHNTKLCNKKEETLKNIVKRLEGIVIINDETNPNQRN